MRHVLAAAVVAFSLGPARAQTPSILDHPGDEVLMRLSATGVQVYECREAAGKAAWAFREPRAQLLIGGRPVGRHFAGPSWELEDGSRIVGTVMASLPAPRPEDIPWLRLAVASHAGNGALGPVTAVERVATHGGALTGACTKVGEVAEVPYTAEYVMMRTAP